jgi:RNA polymerase sigma-70 factor, ECF subfamily
MLQLAKDEGAAVKTPAQFSRLFDDYHGLVFRTAYRLTGNAADAEDVLQTIFLRLVRRSDASVINEESYFRRAAVNASLDLIRARKSDLTVPLRDSSPAKMPDPREMQDCLRRAFTTLTPRAAEIFALRHIEGLSNAQIADMLGISQMLVAVTLHRARRQLQKEIGSYLGGKS